MLVLTGCRSMLEGLCLTASVAAGANLEMYLTQTGNRPPAILPVS